MILTKRNFKNHIITILITCLLLLLKITPTSASSDFSINSSLNIYLKNSSDSIVTVEEILEIETSNPNYYIPKGSEQIVPIKKDGLVTDTLSVTNKYGHEKGYTLEEEGGNLVITLTNRNNIAKDSPFFAKIQYQTEEFINQSGNIANLYLPGLHEDVRFEHTDESQGLKTKYRYFLTYHVPLDAPPKSYITPSSIQEEISRDYRTYTFLQKDRIKNTGWIQLGEEQFYYFKVAQTIPKTDFLTPKALSKYTNWLSTNILELAIPREFTENNQNVFIKNISPQPKRIRTDQEGNIVGIFEIDANKDKEVVIEGYIKLSKSIKEIPDFTISQYKERIQELSELETYTQSDRYWESDEREIIDIANELLSQSDDSSILDLIRNNYNFVIDRLEYSIQKAEGDNVRVGALKALQGAESVCMEYADLMVAILRAQGIPSRAAFGYGNDPLITDTDEKIGHQWLQIWIPDYGWLSVDPTWGETGREYIGGDLDHILWYTVGDSKQKVTDFAIYTADTVDAGIFGLYNVNIEALHESNVPDFSQLQTISDISMQYATQTDEEMKEIEYILKTTMLGRALIFIVPIAVVLLTITTISILTSKFLRLRNR